MTQSDVFVKHAWLLNGLLVNNSMCYKIGAMKIITSPQHTTRLIEAAITIAGSEAKLGKLAGYSQNAIWSAKRNGRVSAELAAAIDRATRGSISRAQLRPDIFMETSPEEAHG